MRHRKKPHSDVGGVTLQINTSLSEIGSSSSSRGSKTKKKKTPLRGGFVAYWVRSDSKTEMRTVAVASPVLTSEK